MYEYESLEVMSEAEPEAWTNEPIELPAGVIEIDHLCSMLVADGYDEEEATVTMELELDESKGYYRQTCPHCAACYISPVIE